MGNNILESVRPGWEPFRKRKDKPPVTIIIAIVCADSIVVASDSQVSASSLASSKRMDGDKIHEVRFKNGCGILANSGSITFGQRAVEITQAACSGQDLMDYRQLAETAEKAVRQMDAAMTEPYHNAGVTVSSFDEIRRQYNYSLLAAYYFEGKPQLFTIDCPPGVATKQKNYAAVGCGAGVAEFLISWFDFGKMRGHEAAVTAAFIIGEVKKADCYCGGPTQVRLLYAGAPRAMPFPDEVMPMIEAEVEKASVHYKNQWSASMLETIREIAKKI